MIPIPAARTLTVPADGTVFAGRGLLRGWNIRNGEADAATTVEIYDGTGTSGIPIANISVAAGATSTVFPSSGAIVFERGLWVDRDADTVLIVLYFNTETRITSALGLFDDDTVDITELGVFRLQAELGSASP